MSAARAMNPRPLVIPLWNALADLDGEVGAGQPGEDAAQDDVAVAEPDDVDAHRLGRAWVLAHGACAAPSVTGTGGTGAG